MWTKLFIIFILTGAFSNGGYSQTNHSEVKNNVAFIHTFHDKDSISSGSGFIAKYKVNLYLVTTYALLTNRSPDDTIHFLEDKHSVPNRIEIRFLSKSKTYHVIKNFYLLNTITNKRVIHTEPAVFNKKTKKYQVTNIAILPIDISNDILVKPVDMLKIDSSWTVNEKDPLSIYGFPAASHASAYIPDSISRFGAKAKSFNYNDSYIITQPYRDNLDGASGSPVFKESGSTESFIGMFCQQLGLGKSFIAYILSGKYIKAFFHQLK